MLRYLSCGRVGGEKKFMSLPTCEYQFQSNLQEMNSTLSGTELFYFVSEIMNMIRKLVYFYEEHVDEITNL